MVRRSLPHAIPPPEPPIATRFGGVHKLALAGRMGDPRDPPHDAP